MDVIIYQKPGQKIIHISACAMSILRTITFLHKEKNKRNDHNTLASIIQVSLRKEKNEWNDHNYFFECSHLTGYIAHPISLNIIIQIEKHKVNQNPK